MKVSEETFGMREELDLKEIEEELKSISPWPWHSVGCYEIRSNLPKVELVGFGIDVHNQIFIAKSPERIAALVKWIRDIQSTLLELKNIDEEIVKNIEKMKRRTLLIPKNSRGSKEV